MNGAFSFFSVVCLLWMETVLWGIVHFCPYIRKSQAFLSGSLCGPIVWGIYKEWFVSYKWSWNVRYSCSFSCQGPLAFIPELMHQWPGLLLPESMLKHTSHRDFLSCARNSFWAYLNSGQIVQIWIAIKILTAMLILTLKAESCSVPPLCQLLCQVVTWS